MPKGTPDENRPDGQNAATESSGWAMLSYMIGGMALYGAIGWLIGRWVHVPVLFPVGMLAGLALGVALIIFRVTRS